MIYFIKICEYRWNQKCWTSTKLEKYMLEKFILAGYLLSIGNIELE